MNPTLNIEMDIEADSLLSREFADADAPNQRAPNYLPTPAEIRELCAGIQAGWSDEERYLRARGSTHEPDAAGDA